jgi:hypothetical protein
MIAPFDAPRLKIERAKKHLHELESAALAYFSAKPVAIVVEPFPGMDPTKAHAWIARIRHPVPATLSPIIGDVVHNLRTALDLLACDLVRVNGKSAKSVYFPFCDSSAELHAAIKGRNLYRAGADVVRVIESLKPYKGGNIALRAIHDMDIADKHQALLPVIGAVTTPGGTIHHPGGIFQLPEWSTTVAKDGQIVIGMPATTNLPLGTELPARLLLAFGDGPGFKGRQMLQFLHELTETADCVLDTLAALRPGAAFPTASA